MRLTRLRQDDEAERLPLRQPERLGAVPLPRGDRLDGAAHDLGRVGHHRQGEAQDRLGPVGERDAQPEDADLEGDQEHAQEQQHQPGRVAEQLRDDARRTMRTSPEPRELGDADRHAGHGADRPSP